MIPTKYDVYKILFNDIFLKKFKEDKSIIFGNVIRGFNMFEKGSYNIVFLGKIVFTASDGIYEQDRKDGWVRFFDFISNKWVFFNPQNRDFFYTKNNNFSNKSSENLYYFNSDPNKYIIRKDWDSFKEFMS